MPIAREEIFGPVQSILKFKYVQISYAKYYETLMDGLG